MKPAKRFAISCVLALLTAFGAIGCEGDEFAQTVPQSVQHGDTGRVSQDRTKDVSPTYDATKSFPASFVGDWACIGDGRIIGELTVSPESLLWSHDDGVFPFTSRTIMRAAQVIIAEDQTALEFTAGMKHRSAWSRAVYDCEPAIRITAVGSDSLNVHIAEYDVELGAGGCIEDVGSGAFERVVAQDFTYRRSGK